MIAIDNPSVLPGELIRSRSPVVVIATKELEGSHLEGLKSQIRELGLTFVSQCHFDCDGYFEMKFFRGYAEVFHTFPSDHVWLASRALCGHNIPFSWGSSQGYYMFVPDDFAASARSVLLSDPRLSARVIVDSTKDIAPR
ncbi:MAG: hypothetical protein ACK501_17090 [Planctomycetota bacterium]